jgi:hypothetical protein
MENLTLTLKNEQKKIIRHKICAFYSEISMNLICDDS